MGLEVVLSSCVTGNKKIKTMPVLASTYFLILIFIIFLTFLFYTRV